MSKTYIQVTVVIFMIIFSMFIYLKDIILEVLEDIRYMNNNNIPTPTLPGIFNVDEYSEDFDSTASNLTQVYGNTTVYINMSKTYIYITVTFLWLF